MEQSIEATVYKEIRDTILNGGYRVEENLSEASLSKKMGMSRSPIRTALKQLEQEGLVEYRKNRGVFIRESSLKEMADASEIAIELMVLATRQVQNGQGVFYIEKLQMLLDEAKKYRKNQDYVRYVNKISDLKVAIMESAQNQLLVPTFKMINARVVSTSLLKKATVSNDLPNKTITTPMFFQAYLDFVKEGKYEEAIAKLRDYFVYTTNQIFHYGRL